MKTLRAALLGVGVLGSSVAIAATGYQLDTQSAKATGMAGAVTADVNDSSAIYYNPAGLAQGPGIDVQLGDTLIIPSFSFTDNAGNKTNSERPVAPPFHVYAALGWDDTWSFGLGVFTPFGSIVQWPSGWEGSGAVERIDLRTYDFNPTAAAHFGAFRIGAGLQIVRATLGLTQGIVLPDSLGTLNAGLGAWGVGGNGGIQYEIVPDRLQVGFNYRSAVSLNFSGTATATNIPPELQALFGAQQSVSTHLTLPHALTLGLAGKPWERVRLGVDATYVTWQQYGESTFSFSNPALDQTIVKQWAHTWSIHAGGQYTFSEAWAGRLGVAWDENAAPTTTVTPDLPDSSRVTVSAGLGYIWGPLHVDVAYQHVFLMGYTATTPALPGKYTAAANVVGLTLGFHI
jgi:long-chain fatty acid transport protein